MKSLFGSFDPSVRTLNPYRALIMGLALAAVATAASAGVIAADSGQVVNDSSTNVAWAADANLFKTLETQSGNATTFVNTIITDSGGQVGTYTLTSADFSTSDGRMTWFGAEAWISYLNQIKYLGYSTWRLPTTVNALSSQSDTPDPSSSELAELVITELGGQYNDSVITNHNTNFSLFINLQSGLYWSGTQYTNPTAAWSFNLLPGEDSQDYNAKGNLFYVLPLMSGQIGASATPEPGSAWLITAGIASLSAFAMRRRASR